MLLYILLGLAAIIAGMLIAASTKPNTVHYERSAVINTPPERILAQIDDFRKWSAWSPWEKLDPGMKREYGGPTNGLGANYHWIGNKKAGEGRMAITGQTADSVSIDLHFIKPMEARSRAMFRIQPEGPATRLTWTMDGPNSIMGKVFGLFVNMDKMIGKDFEAGLAAIKREAEKP